MPSTFRAITALFLLLALLTGSLLLADNLSQASSGQPESLPVRLAVISGSALVSDPPVDPSTPTPPPCAATDASQSCPDPTEEDQNALVEVERSCLEQGSVLARAVEDVAASEHILDSATMFAVLTNMIAQESGWNPAVGASSAGAIGIAQLLPETASDYGVQPADPNASLVAAASFMGDLYGHFHDWIRAAAAYNAGPDTVDAALARWRAGDGPSGDELRQLPLGWTAYLPSETVDYIKAVFPRRLGDPNFPVGLGVGAPVIDPLTCIAKIPITLAQGGNAIYPIAERSDAGPPPTPTVTPTPTQIRPRPTATVTPTATATSPAVRGTPTITPTPKKK